MAEKSVIASISQAEEQPFQNPATVRTAAVVSEPAQQKRRFFLLLYFQLVGSPSILGEACSGTSHRVLSHGASKGCKIPLVGTVPPRSHSSDTAAHRAKRGGFLCLPRDGVLFVNGIVIPAWSKWAFLLSAFRPPGRPSGSGLPPELRPAYSRMRCLPHPRVEEYLSCYGTM